MVTAVIPNADALIAERRASGNDRFDEVIKGVYSMVPPSSSRHRRQQVRLGVLLLAHELIVASEGGVGFPDDYVIPDLVVYRTEVSEESIFADPSDVEFVVEIRADSNTGTHREAKLARLSDWGLPAVIFDGDNIANRSDLDSGIVDLFDQLAG